ncbi:MAG: F0F1 ATP synthase subunit B [Phycisphaerae bacterium]|jgi:F-type H+-transporting ATPase subunit b
MTRHRECWLKAVVFLGACSTWASASEGASEGGPSLFTGDLGNIFWTLLTFTAVLFVLGKFAWGPILGALQKREDFIRDSLQKAKEDREQAELRLKEYAEKLDAARAEASAIVDEGRRDAEELRKKLEAKAKDEADTILERAKREISIATDTAVKELYTLSARLATDVASRVIRKELDPKEHERLVAESIEELKKVNGKSKNMT